MSPVSSASCSSFWQENEVRNSSVYLRSMNQYYLYISGNTFCLNYLTLNISAVPGRYGWDGGLGTSWYVDPREDMITLLMTPRALTTPQPPNVTFWTQAYQATDD